MLWEKLVKKILVHKYEEIFYYEYIPNGTIPVFLIKSEKIILDAKRHDFLRIEEYIEKYLPYCKKIIFICMEKKRINWKSNFKKLK